MVSWSSSFIQVNNFFSDSLTKKTYISPNSYKAHPRRRKGCYQHRCY